MIWCTLSPNNFHLLFFPSFPTEDTQSRETLSQALHLRIAVTLKVNLKYLVDLSTDEVEADGGGIGMTTDPTDTRKGA